MVSCRANALSGRRSEQAFVALLPCSMYATGATFGNGQLVVLLLPLLIGSLLLLDRTEPSWRSDAASRIA